jgi:hypothetical protein
MFVLTFTLCYAIHYVFISTENVLVGQGLLIAGLLFMVCECQFMIFLPNLLNIIITQKRDNYSITSGIMVALNNISNINNNGNTPVNLNKRFSFNSSKS